jgi:hypothetical protein
MGVSIALIMTEMNTAYPVETKFTIYHYIGFDNQSEAGFKIIANSFPLVRSPQTTPKNSLPQTPGLALGVQ